jgi:hypothetical protein
MPTESVSIIDDLNKDSNGVSNQLKIQADGSLDVNMQDQTTRPLDLYFHQQQGTVTTTTALTVKDTYTVDVASVTDFSLGDTIGIFSGGLDGNIEGAFYFGEVLNITGTTITIDSPMDTVFQIGSPVASLTKEMNVNGSVTPQVFSIQAGGATGTIDVDITRILPKMITTNPPEFSMFGDIVGGLTRGLVIRRVNGLTQNIVNWKTNGEIANFMFDLDFYDQTRPQGVNGIVGRFTYAGQSKHGVAVRLDPGERLDIIIQDDLTSLLSFRMVAEGHEVTEAQ